MAIVGIGIDVVDIERFTATIGRTPAMAAKLFTPGEREVAKPERLAARFAAKEAVAKALGAPGGLRWHDCEVVVSETGRPLLEVRGTVLTAARRLGVATWQLSLSHDGGVAIAMVVAES